MAFTFDVDSKTLSFAIRDFSAPTQRLIMSTLDVNGLLANEPAFKKVVSEHIQELVKDPAQLDLARQIAAKGQILPLLRDETNALNFLFNTYQMQLSNIGKEAASRKICIDFDHTLSQGHAGGVIDPPVEGAIAALQKLKQEGYEIVIYSCRANSDHGHKQIEEWLKKYSAPYDEIFIGKPMAVAYIDDRAIPFKGNWAEVLKELSTKSQLINAFDITGAFYVEAGTGPKELALGLGLALAPSIPAQGPAAPASHNVQKGWEHFEAAAKAAAASYGVPVDMFVRLLHTENSSGKPWAVNPNSGAAGLAQFMPETAKERGINPFDAAESIEGAAKYLTDLHHEFGNWEDAVRAYNWGPGNVKHWLAKGGEVPTETQEYIKKIAPPPKQHVKRHRDAAFLPSLPGVVWETHDGPDMQHSPSTPLEMLHPVNQDNTYDSMTAIHDKKDPADLLHFLSLEDKAKELDQACDTKEEDEANVERNVLETTLGKRDIAKVAATNEEHMTHIKGLVDQRQFEKAIGYIEENKLNAPKLLKGLEDRSAKATILNKDQALLLIDKGSQGAQSNAVKWLAKNNSINELAAAFPLVAFNPAIAKEIIGVFRNSKNVIVLNRLFTDTSIPDSTRREIVETLVGINYIPIVDEAIKDDSEQIRSAGYKAASRLKAKDHLLEEGTKDPSAKIRREVYGYLWEAKTPAAMDLFYKGQEDEDPSIQNFVKDKVGNSGTTIPRGEPLTKKQIEEGVLNATEYFKQHPEIGETQQKEREEREKNIQYNKSLAPEKKLYTDQAEWKKLWEEAMAAGMTSEQAGTAASKAMDDKKFKSSALSKEAIQPPCYTHEIMPAVDFGERDDGLLAKDVKQYYGRPKSEFRNNMNLLPELLKKMVEDEDMDKPADKPVKLGAGNVSLPPGTPFRLKQDLAPLKKGTPGYVLWPSKIQPYKYNPTVYAVWMQGVEANFKEGDIEITDDMMEFEAAAPKLTPEQLEDKYLNPKEPGVTPAVEEMGQSIADQIREEIKKEKEFTPQDIMNRVVDPKALALKRDQLIDKANSYPEGSPGREKYMAELRRLRSSLSQKEAGAYDNFEQEEIYNQQTTERQEAEDGPLVMDRDWIEDTQTFPRGRPSPPARWVDPDREEGEVGGEKLQNGPTYWDSAIGVPTGMTGPQSFSSLTVVVDDSGTRTICTWDEEDAAPELDEATVVAALTTFIRTNMPHVAKFKSISLESADLFNRNIVLKLDGEIPESNGEAKV